ncbi:FAD/NAD(P)-binding protein [soil metagenome]
MFVSSSLSAVTGPRIAVIGAGFSGLLTAVHLSRKLPGAELWLIEKGPRFAEGAAYGTREADHVLNVRLNNMSAFPDDPAHLSRWLATQPQWSSQGAFITRGDYGRYLRSILSEALDGPNSRLKLVHDEVTSLTRETVGWRVAFGAGDSLAADVAVLALGNLEPARPSGLDEGVVAAGRYIGDPWRAASALGDDVRRVLLIGSSLTMVDVALTHARPGRRFFALSRRGLGPRAHKAADLVLASQSYEGSPVRVLRQARKAALTSDWRAVTDDLRRSAGALWRSWKTAERSRFLRHLRPIWDVHRHRLAPTVANRMHSMIAAGELSIEAGRISRIEAADQKVLVTWRPRGWARTTTKKVDVVINCTGPLADVNTSQIPLIQGLVASGFARADAQGLGLDVDDDCRVRDVDGAAQDELYAVGPMTRGAFWEVTSVPDIRVQAADVAETIAYTSG